jgi:hypothetical protein
MFKIFCKRYRLTAVPASPKTICRFATFLAIERHLEFSSIQNYIASLPSLHHAHDLPSPDITHFSVKDTLAGIRRRRVELPHRKSPLLPTHLLDIYSKLAIVPANYRATFWAACLVAFFSLFRRSNLFHSRRNTKFIRTKNVDMSDKSKLLLTVPVLKTCKFASADLTVPLAAIRHSELCPVTAVRKLVSSVPLLPDSPLFSYIGKDGKLTAMHADLFSDTLKKTLAAAGYPPQKFSAHSFRRGAATFAASLGVTSEELKAQGNWSSSCFERYIVRDPALRLSFTKAVTKHLSGSFGYCFGRSAPFSSS